MKHRHLLPNEIDLLVDGEAGFGVADLRTHIDECVDCRARYEEERVIVDALEALPHFVPDSRLADRVMSRVPLFVPAHVAARDSVSRWIPQAGPARIAAMALFTTAASVLTLSLVWLAAQGDAAVFMTSLVGERVRTAILLGGKDVLVSLLGDSALSALQATGAIGVSLVIAGFALTALGTVAGIRRLATAGRR